MERFSRKTAVVTGGSRGIGKATAARFVKAGIRTLICSRTEEKLQAAVRDIVESAGYADSVESIAADLSLPDDARRIVDRISSWHSGLDLLINNASILGPLVSLDQYPIEEWNRVLSINLTGPFLVTRGLLPLMNSEGCIINISSSVGRRGREHWGAYAVSKFGLEGMSQVLADELRNRKIRVYSLNPGRTRTRMRALAYPDEDPESLPSSERAAEVIYRLAMEAHYASGSILSIEHGKLVIHEEDPA